MTAILFTLMGIALHFTHGHFYAPGLIALSVLFVAAIFLYRTRTRPPLKTLIAIQLAFVIYSPFLLYPQHITSWRVLQYGAIAALFFLLTNKWVSWIWIAMALVVSKAAVIITSPTPAIDVHVWLTQAVDYFLQGTNPYGASYVDLSSAAYGYKGVYSYGPTLLYFLAPFRALYLDVRWGLLLCDLVTAYSVLKITKKPTWSLLWLSWPVSWFLLEQSWVDTAMIGFFALAALIYYTSRSKYKIHLFGIALGLTIGIKQYAILLIALIVCALWKELAKRDRKVLLISGFSTGLLLYLPFFLMNREAMTYSLIEFYKAIPIRLDAMTWRAYFAIGNGGQDLLVWIDTPALILGVFAAICFAAFKSKSKERLSLAHAFCFIFFGFICLFGTHSFCNQYHFLGFLGFYGIMVRES